MSGLSESAPCRLGALGEPGRAGPLIGDLPLMLVWAPSSGAHRPRRASSSLGLLARLDRWLSLPSASDLLFFLDSLVALMEDRLEAGTVFNLDIPNVPGAKGRLAESVQ